MLIKDILINQWNNHKIAIKFGPDAITYSQLNNIVEINTHLIRHLDIRVDNIGIFLPNSIQYAIAYFTITFFDKVIVPIGIQAKKAEIKSTIDYCELKIIITNNLYRDILIGFLGDLEYKITIFNLDEGSFEEIGLNVKTIIDTERPYMSTGDDNIAIMLHTSGTTNNPKRVMLTHSNLLNNIKSNIESLKLNKNDRVLIALPMFFGYCNTAQFLTHLYLGASIIIMDNMFMPNYFFKLVQDEKVTNFTGVPSMLLMLLNFRNKYNYNISSLKYICFGGGNMPVEKLRQIIEAFPTVGFVQTYGQTEASPRVTCLLPEDSLRKIGSVGKTIPYVQVRIVDEGGKDVNIGETGEIIVKGKNVMKGYYKRPTETENTIRNGWLYTGDLAKYDEEKYIYLVGRKKNIIISGGLNIYPEEVEEQLMCHPAVKEVYVVGETHEILGEVPIAKVLLKDNIDKISEGELKNFCLDRLADYKVPNKIVFVEEFPKTATGKIKRY